MVAVTEAGKRLVGHIAKRQAITNAENTVYAAKRLIGRKWNSPQVKNAVATLELPHRRGPARRRAHRSSATRTYSRPRDQRDGPPGDEGHRRGLPRRAGHQGRRHRARLLQRQPAPGDEGRRRRSPASTSSASSTSRPPPRSPTASARTSRRPSRSTTSAAARSTSRSSRSARSGVFKVIATAGDTFLGGEDFDARIIDWLVQGFKEEHGIDLRQDRMALQRLQGRGREGQVRALERDARPRSTCPFIISSGRNEALHLQRTLDRADARGALRRTSSSAPSTSASRRSRTRASSKDEIDEVRPRRRHDAHAARSSRRSPSSSSASRARACTPTRSSRSAPAIQGVGARRRQAGDDPARRHAARARHHDLRRLLRGAHPAEHDGPDAAARRSSPRAATTRRR